LFLWLLKDNVCPTWSDWQPEVLAPRFWTSERASSSCETRIVSRQEDATPRKAPSSTALFVKQFFWKKFNMVLQHPLTHQISLLVDFFLSLPWRTISKDHGLKPLNCFERSRQAF
jgi:hypothetical protein